VKIDTSVKSLNPASGQSAAAKGAVAPGSAGGNSVQGTQVQLSPQATALLGAEAVLKESPVVDAKRVAEIKQAIAEGRFSINPENIADSLLENVRQMLQGRQSH
jgi:negative regulator of flagellin synthesis FlgM